MGSPETFSNWIDLLLSLFPIATSATTPTTASKECALVHLPLISCPLRRMMVSKLLYGVELGFATPAKSIRADLQNLLN